MKPERSAARSTEAPAGTPHAPTHTERPDEVRWQLRDAAGNDCRHLVDQLRIHPVTARVLVARGWNTPALAGRFLDPNWSDILDPSYCLISTAPLLAPSTQSGAARGS